MLSIISSDQPVSSLILVFSSSVNPSDFVSDASEQFEFSTSLVSVAFRGHCSMRADRDVRSMKESQHGIKILTWMPNGSPGFFFLKKTFRMNEQPVSQIPFKGDWGRLPQRADLWRLHRRENRENEWTCTGLHCLPICENSKTLSSAPFSCSICHFVQWIQK